MLTSPSHAVVGSQDPETTCELLARFGFEQHSERRLATEVAEALYGLEAPTEEVGLGVPGTERGGVRVVRTPHGPISAGSYDPRPIAVDLYTRDIEESLQICRDAGLQLGQLVDYAVGPLELREFEAEDEQGLRLVFIEIANRRPSVLDRDPDRLHSEVHSIVFAVPSAEEALALWHDAGGLDVLVDAPIEGPVISRLMGLPRPEVPVRFVLMCDGDANPARFEVIEFVDDPGSPVAAMPLRSGLHAVAFEVDDLAAAKGRLVGCAFGPKVTVEGRGGRTGIAPGGLAFELWASDVDGTEEGNR